MHVYIMGVRVWVRRLFDFYSCISRLVVDDDDDDVNIFTLIKILIGKNQTAKELKRRFCVKDMLTIRPLNSFIDIY